MNIINHNKVKLQLAELIQYVFRAAEIDEPLQDIYNAIGFPPDATLGHYTFPCFTLAKKLKNVPNKIAEQVAKGFVADKMLDSAQSVGPYINFKLTASFLGASTCEEIESGKMFERKLIEEPPKTMIEYSQPNTHKELHVGHMRNICLGDALIRLHRYCGYDIISATFPGDMGTHVAKCLWYLKYHNTVPPPEHNKGAWLGTLYSRGHIKLEEEESTPQGHENKRQLSAILSQL
jgi:arginyl-tRNA synthetase